MKLSPQWMAAVRIMSALELALLLVACTSPSRNETTLEPTATRVGETFFPTLPRATDFPADVILTESQQQLITTVRVGQIINVSDFPNQKWTVNFYERVLASLTASDRMSQPGPTGWFFRVVAPGSTEIVLESIPPTCPAGTTCPPSITRIVFPIQAIP